MKSGVGQILFFDEYNSDKRSFRVCTECEPRELSDTGIPRRRSQNEQLICLGRDGLMVAISAKVSYHSHQEISVDKISG
jgi:hypothetical protein